MKKFWYILPVLACMLVLASCEKKKVDIDPAQLIGHWAAPSSDNPSKNLVFVFLNEPCEVDGTTYGRWGYQYDEGDGVSESDLLDKGPDGQYHKNGWFGWVAGKGEIKFTHMTSVGKAKTPVTNAVSAFDGQTMTMTDAGITYTFTKMSYK